MADTNVAIKLYKTSSTAKRVGINVTNSTDTTGYALYVNGAANINGNLSVSGTISSTGNIYINNTNRGFYVKDSAGNSYRLIGDNGSNLWIGTNQQSSTHHVGETYISSGYNTTNSAGNVTIKISVPNATNTGGTSYNVYHTGYKPTYSDVGAAAASHTHSYAGSSSAGGAATNVNVTTKSTGNQHYIHCSTGNSGSQATCASADAYLYLESGAVSLNIGGSSTNGRITFRNKASYYTNLVSTTATANRTITLPNATGTVSLEGHTHTYANITDAGTYVYDATVSRTKNTVLAAPNGSAGAASFRALVVADLPTGTTSSTVSLGNHTHKYAGSSSAGGSATSAVKLDTSTAGSAKQPVYFSSGKPVACTTLTSLATGKGYGFADFTLSGAAASYNYLIMFGYVVSGAARVSTIIPMNQISTTELQFQIADYNNSYRSVGIKKSGNDIIFSSTNGYAKSGSSFDVYGGI